MSKEELKYNPGPRNYKIFTTGDGLPFTEFTGIHRPDLESENWHYYDTDCGKRLHFRKEHMVLVVEDKNGN